MIIQFSVETHKVIRPGTRNSEVKRILHGHRQETLEEEPGAEADKIVMPLAPGSEAVNEVTRYRGLHKQDYEEVKGDQLSSKREWWVFDQGDWGK